MLNRGVNGERSDQIRTRFLRTIADREAGRRILLAGVNDIYQGRSAESVERELEAIYHAAREARFRSSPATIVPYNTATPDANARMHAVNAWIREYVAEPPARPRVRRHPRRCCRRRRCGSTRVLARRPSPVPGRLQADGDRARTGHNPRAPLAR